ncbi:MAG TPA: FIST N-terminal domain-containing protein [Methanospirillum sp.]|nr:FIST N-terminal domain-containing protein [Methanospirillum sp.]
MALKVTYTIQSEPQLAASDIASAFSDLKPVAVIFFASSQYDPCNISAAMKEEFPDATVIGCSTAGEIITGKMLKNSIVAMALESDLIEGIASEVIDLQDGQSTTKAVTELAAKFRSKPLDLSVDNFVGMILIDGLSCAEERIMSKIGDLVNITVIGGSAGDDLAFKKTWVYLDGKSYSNSAILTLIKPGCKFDIIKTQSFCGMNKKLIPTVVDENSRRVEEFNGKPAAKVYAEALGVSEAEIESQFMIHPVGLMSDDEPYVRAPHRVEGKSIYFHCQILKNIELEILSPTDIIEETRKAIVLMEKRVGPIKGLINFNCSERTFLLNKADKCDEYGALFNHIPTIGFSTYGEEYIGHMNQTATMLIFY